MGSKILFTHKEKQKFLFLAMAAFSVLASIWIFIGIENNSTGASELRISSQTWSSLIRPSLDTQRKVIYIVLERQPTNGQHAPTEHKLIQQLRALDVRDVQSLEFQRNLPRVFLFGMQEEAVSAGIGWIIASIFGGMGLNRYLARKASLNERPNSTGRIVIKLSKPSRLVQVSRQDNTAGEVFENRRATGADIHDSIPIWTRRDGFISPSKYPRVK